MATYSFSLNGMSMGCGGGNADPPKRGEIQGWTAAAARRNTKFLQSIDPAQLAGREGYALTLTLRESPVSYASWAVLLALFLDRLRKAPGIGLVHWVVEWQERGAPHLHMALYGAVGAGSEPPIRCIMSTTAHGIR